MTLSEKDKQYVWHPFTQAQTSPEPIPIVKGEGVWLFDEEGKKYIDANSSWWTIIHGHAHPYMVEQISNQLSILDHSIFAGATHPKAAEVGERITNVLPENFAKVFFSDNGSTAVEVAIKMVYQYWHNKGIKKKRFLAIEGSYHGDTFGAMSVGQRGYFNRPFEHLFFDVDFIPFPTKENINEVLVKAKELLSSGDFAGFIFEPLVQGAAGMRIYEADWLNELVSIAKEHEVMTIADEVMTGFYRSGKMFAIDHIQEEVDFVCMSKGLTGGVMAMGLTATTQKVFDAFLSDEIGTALLHGHSFTANPIACSAVCASLDLFEKENTQKGIEKIVSSHANFLEKIKGDKRFKSARQQGTILSLEIEMGDESSYFSPIRTEAYNYFLANEILLRPLGNVIFFNPPYVINEEELEHVYSHILKFLDEYFRA
ncbi:MAG: adenosylmethionine--8-amino-7-oxononanoate transaminase [Crocinitomix sp. MedPE-SWsnd]|nr:MAG: adenosylmethionine--8-amino-7-oxononanoate transaminase [Crocinitomix sp. MedPE-SWsnd]